MSVDVSFTNTDAADELNKSLSKMKLARLKKKGMKAIKGGAWLGTRIWC